MVVVPAQDSPHHGPGLADLQHRASGGIHHVAEATRASWLRRRASSPVHVMLPRLGAMIGLLNPVGPETRGTYWARRAFVTGATVVLAIALPLIITGLGSGSAAEARSAIPSAAYSVPISPSPTQTVLATPSAIDAWSTTPATPSPTPTASSMKSTKKSKSQHTKSVSCRAKDLRPTLTGRIRLAPRHGTTFQLSLINGSDRTCTARVSRKNFELKIASSSSRMWSTNDCPSAIKTISRRLVADSAVAWSLSWNGRGSKPDCKSARPAPKPGRYVATARLDGAEPVKLRMILKRGG
jgi:hypothetical protein